MAKKTKSRWEVIKPILVIFILTACAIMLFYGFKEPGVQLTDTQIQVKGMYGLEIDFTDIKDVTLIEKSMREIGIGTRTNGFGGMGSTLKGNFKSADLGKHMLFVMRTHRQRYESRERVMLTSISASRTAKKPRLFFLS